MDIASPAFGIQVGVAWHFPSCITSQFFSCFGYRAILILGRAIAQTEDPTGPFALPPHHFYHYISICGPWLYEAMRRGRHSNTSKSINSSAPKKELDRSGPGQPYHNHRARLCTRGMSSQDQSSKADLPHSMHHRFSPIEVTTPLQALYKKCRRCNRGVMQTVTISLF